MLSIHSDYDVEDTQTSAYLHILGSFDFTRINLYVFLNQFLTDQHDQTTICFTQSKVTSPSVIKYHFLKVRCISCCPLATKVWYVPLILGGTYNHLWC